MQLTCSQIRASIFLSFSIDAETNDVDVPLISNRNGTEWQYVTHNLSAPTNTGTMNRETLEALYLIHIVWFFVLNI